MTESQLCASCLRDKETIQAQLWCTSCAEPVCEPCGKVHRKFAIPHKVVDIAFVSQTCRMMSKECPRHNHQVLDSFCSNHVLLVCPKCVSEYHSECKNVLSINKAMEICNDGNDIKTLKDRIANLNVISERVVSSVNHYDEKLQQDKRSILDEIAKIREFVNRKLDSMEKGVLAKYRKQDGMVFQCKRYIEEMKQSLDSNTAIVDQLGKNLKETREFYLLKHLEATQNTNEKSAESIQQEIKSIKLNMIPANFSRKLTDLFSSLEETGYVDQTETEENLSNSHTRISIDVKEASMLQTLTPTKGFVFEASCFTDDHRIVLTETKWDSNYKLCLFDSKSRHSGRITISLPEEPYRICPFEKSHVLVTCKNQLPILIVDVQSITTGIKRVKPNVTSLPCKEQIKSSECSFIFSKGYQIWVCIQCSTRSKDLAFICNINFNGEILKAVPVTSDIFDMCMNYRNDSFIMTHKKRNCISEISITGEEKQYHKEADLKSGCRIVCDSTGGVFLYEPTTNIIYKLRFGEKKPVLTDRDEILNVSYINFNQRTNELVVTSNDGDKVIVYHVQV